MDDPIIEVGDIVRIKSYKTCAMDGTLSEGRYQHKIGFIESTRYLYKCEWESRKELVVQFPLPETEKWQLKECCVFRADGVKLIEKSRRGPGVLPIAGIDYEIPRSWDKWITFFEWEWNFKKTDQTFEGFSNAATYLAWLYLNNDKRALDLLISWRRKDGTINANKVRKAFYERGNKIDDWALELPIDVPAPIKDWAYTDKYKPRVDWKEVAYEFADLNPAK